MKHVGIVMSAGKGLRVGGDIPKQYMELCGKPVLYYCLFAMQQSFIDEIVVVCGEGDEDFVKKEIVDKYSLDKVKHIVKGGKERSDSVYNGLMEVDDPKHTYVYIQDGARPLLSVNLLNNIKEDVEAFGSAVAGVRTKDTVKIVDENGFVVETPDRNTVWNIQTPQAFVCSDLLDAFSKLKMAGEVPVTDDSSVMEMFGNLPVHITEASYTNIKITTSEDFLTAQNFLKEI